MYDEGRRALSGGGDRTLKVWDLERGEVITTFSGDSAITACFAASDGRMIVAGSALGRVHVLRLEGVE